MASVLAYILLVVSVNYGFVHVPLVILPNGEVWPPMALAVGFVFVVRDFAQRQVGHKIIFAMLLACAASYFMASPAVAFASALAFIASEVADWAVYSFTKKPFANRVLISSVVSTPVDSFVFLAFIGHLSVFGVVAMTLSKMIGAGIVFAILRRNAARA